MKSSVHDEQTKEARYNRLYMNLAEEVAQMSYAKRRQVGAVAIKDGNILGFGFNGTPAGFPNNCEDEDGKTFDWVLHAEVNLIAKLAKSTMSLEDATVYVTTSPCMTCAKMLAQSGVKQVFYRDAYSKEDGLYLLNKLNIGVSQL